jgi:hypothetical protein
MEFEAPAISYKQESPRAQTQPHRSGVQLMSPHPFLRHGPCSKERYVALTLSAGATQEVTCQLANSCD